LVSRHSRRQLAGNRSLEQRAAPGVETLAARSSAAWPSAISVNKLVDPCHDPPLLGEWWYGEAELFQLSAGDSADASCRSHQPNKTPSLG